MNRRLLLLALTIMTVGLNGQTSPGYDPRRPQTEQKEEDVKLPNGKSQRQEIVKLDYQKALDDAVDLVRLSEELKAILEKDGHSVFSLTAVKKTEEIEKLAKRIRSRIKGS